MPDQTTPRLGHSRDDIAAIAREEIAGMVSWKALIGVLLGVAAALATVGTYAINAASAADEACDKAAEAKAAAKVNAREKLARERAVETYFPRADGLVLKTKLDNVIEAQKKQDAKLDEILRAVQRNRR
jgi:hypothetical protein